MKKFACICFFLLPLHLIIDSSLPQKITSRIDSISRHWRCLTWLGGAVSGLQLSLLRSAKSRSGRSHLFLVGGHLDEIVLGQIFVEGHQTIDLNRKKRESLFSKNKTKLPRCSKTFKRCSFSSAWREGKKEALGRVMSVRLMLTTTNPDVWPC